MLKVSESDLLVRAADRSSFDPSAVFADARSRPSRIDEGMDRASPARLSAHYASSPTRGAGNAFDIFTQSPTLVLPVRPSHFRRGPSIQNRGAAKVPRRCTQDDPSLTHPVNGSLSRQLEAGPER